MKRTNYIESTILIEDHYPVMIDQQEYDKLKEDSRILKALRAAGVDNWEGYDIAMESLHGEV